MDIENADGYFLNNLSKINVILGKNGSGKSILLRKVEQYCGNQPANFGKTRYITPERGGALSFEAGVEQSIANQDSWLPNQRRRNQSVNFRQQSVALYRKLESVIRRELEDKVKEIEAQRSNNPRISCDYSKYFFENTIAKINNLLDNIQIKPEDYSFSCKHKQTGNPINPDSISSGESELVSLAIECLTFQKECLEEKENLLFLDEPDVHLHPDLQLRFMKFLKELVENGKFSVIIATHSTPLLGALSSYDDTHIGFLGFGNTNVTFQKISETHKKVLPIFGAHPLSNIFNENPILLVEGEDDERIWQQAVRSSEGKIQLYPCSVESVQNLNNFEQEARSVIEAVYDSARGYSLRDRDDSEGEIGDLGPIIRMKTKCRNAENLLLSNQVLEFLGVTWGEVKAGIEEWLEKHPDHAHFAEMKSFKDSGFDRMNKNIKEIRNDFLMIIGTNKPWEVAVGQTISSLEWDDSIDFGQEGSIFSFLGEKATKNLLYKRRA